MGSPADLTLGTHAASSNVNATNAVLKSSLPFVGDHLESIRKIEEYLQALEDERRKIEAFKRELPFCMQLLEEAIESSKEQLAENRNVPTTLQAADSSPSGLRGLEFIPLKQPWEKQQKDEGDDQEGDRSECPRRVNIRRSTWMTEAQLWIQRSEPPALHRENDMMSLEDVGRHPNAGQSEQEQSSVTNSKFLLSSKERPAGAFWTFIREQQVTAAPLLSGTTTGTGSGADLSLSSPDHVSSPNGHGFGGAESEVGSIDASLRTPDQISDAQGCKGIRPQSNGVSGAESTRVSDSQSQRKLRRCWTPELHRRFVGALQQLGGSQVATPKQIRELMKVDGLSNDEVKSHLQKYRLHTRRASTSSQSASAQAPQMVGIWVPPEYAAVAAAAAAQPTSVVYDPSPPSAYCQASHPQDYFTCNKSTGSSGGQLVHHPTTFEPPKSASLSQSSPQGPLQLSSQLSGGAQEVSNEDSGGGDVKSDSTSSKSCQLGDEGKEN